MNNDVDVMKVLIDSGADVKTVDDHRCIPLHLCTPLHLAAWSNKSADVILVEAGADVNAKDYDQQTPLYKAAGYNDVNVVRVLIDNGADVRAEDRYLNTPMHHAESYTKSADVITALIEAGAVVNEQWTLSTGQVSDV